MQKWKYLVVQMKGTEAKLNSLGADGWELVAIGDGDHLAYFKRAY
jgi:hypothetical protein